MALLRCSATYVHRKLKEARLGRAAHTFELLINLKTAKGYELVPARGGKSRKGRSFGTPSSLPTGGVPPLRGRGRPRKDGIPAPKGEGATAPDL